MEVLFFSHLLSKKLNYQMNILYYIVLLFFITLVYYIPNFFNNGVFLDGWYLELWIKKNKKNFIKKFYNDAGSPYLIQFHNIFSRSKFTNKSIVFLSLFLASSFIFFITLKFHYTALHAFIISALYLTYPGNQITIEKTVSQYYFFTAVFYLGWLIIFYNFPFIDIASMTFFLFGIILIFSSFLVNSLLVLYYPLLLILIFKSFKSFDLFVNTQNLIITIFLISLPFLFWVFKNRIFIQSDAYKEYYKFKLNYKKIFFQILESIYIGLIIQILNLFTTLLKNSKIGLVLFPCLLIFIFSPIIIVQNYNEQFLVNNIFIIILLISSIFPYVFVGQRIGVHGWATKNNILISFPYALIIFILTINYSIKIPLIIIFFSIIYLLFVNLCWISLWVKQLSLLINISETVNKKKYSIIILDDLIINSLTSVGKNENWVISTTCMFQFYFNMDDILVIPLNKLVNKFNINNPISENDFNDILNSTTLDFTLNKVKYSNMQLYIKVENSYLNNSLLYDIFISLKFMLYKFNILKFKNNWIKSLTNVIIVPIKNDEI
jgi:hypothetical protein